MRIAIDIGGTFVDVVLMGSDGSWVRVEKVPSTADGPERGVLTALDRARSGLSAATEIVHGTTSGLNAILQRRGAAVGLITNTGFEDVLEIGRGDVPWADMYTLGYQRPPQIVPRRRIRGVGGRITFRGTVLTEPTEEDIARAVRELVIDEGCDALAVVLLHAYANGEHESMVKRVAGTLFPTVPVSVSSEVAPEYREYERTSTTVLEAYIRPIVGAYLDRLEQALREREFGGQFLVMRSAGGATSASLATERPLITVLSGPAGGVTGAAHLAVQTGRMNVISLDVGGTSTDVCLVRDGTPAEVYEGRVDGWPVIIPIYDIRTIGAGGGSIARVDDGILRVGPASAGAHPGPMCYMTGGDRVTVTDAAVALGYITASEFLAGQLRLSEEAAREGVDRQIAEPLGVTRTEAAIGVLRVAATNTLSALRELTVEHGLDPSDFTLVAFGGAGPLFSSIIMREMGLSEVVIPPISSTFSAFGMLMAELSHEMSQTYVSLVTPETEGALWEAVADLAKRAEAEAAAHLPSTERLATTVGLDLRYEGQEHSIVVYPGVGADAHVVHELFASAHSRRYGHRLESAVEVVAIRVKVGRETAAPAAVMVGRCDPVPLSSAGRSAFDLSLGAPTLFRVFERSALAPNVETAGPCVVTDGTSNVLVFSDEVIQVDSLGSLIIRRRGELAEGGGGTNA